MFPINKNSVVKVVKAMKAKSQLLEYMNQVVKAKKADKSTMGHRNRQLINTINHQTFQYHLWSGPHGLR